MNKLIFFSMAILLFVSKPASAQVIDGLPWDSTIVRFTSGIIPEFIPDTSATPLWQIGHCRKTIFGVDTIGETVMITDTLMPYRRNENNWFVIKMALDYLNPIVDFWHKYQTDKGHAGGIVEFSVDHGANWQNVKGNCNSDSVFSGHGVLTTNFYTFNDTLNTGQPAFTGTQDTEQYSRIQFFEGYPVRKTSGSYCSFSVDSIYLRFRFVSDTATDTLAGWVIDSIKIEQDYWEGGVAAVNKQKPLNVYPNPSYDGRFNFPVLSNEQNYNTEVYNAIGEKIVVMPYQQVIDISGYAKGLYFYKVSDGTEYYSGQLLVE